MAFLACVIGVIGWFRPVSAPPPTDPAPTYTAAEVQAAKDKVCDAFELVDKALRITTNADGGEDVALRQALAANARLALVASAQSLKGSSTSASPPSLAETVADFESSAIDLALRYLAGGSREDSELLQAKATTEALAGELRADCG
ncbi:hypothetical protein [Mycolicibacterium brumae]|uniref:Alanine and proline rich membrane protein n=1 Tax=Mycolicibacterium brumae TaxID=85968 RepID=A0A2G5P4P1_9MYCO|nr:hypothetical protein [Mycolicibacterium brumae]MCV7193767.1 hypothetical protein [Mycolicibacterium brumae]PIB73090.1 hypothetical protein CQY22_018335 [Mycolicibacterium brumae]RWA21472.1 hypothetical protein MBRU_14765 [Mycolicibacterium brumae DSM 44177]UWW07317.1 hypothetical protein L2Z93_000322 [Mycolicibacterium brumae]